MKRNMHNEARSRKVSDQPAQELEETVPAGRTYGLFINGWAALVVLALLAVVTLVLLLPDTEPFERLRALLN